jgi:hypothetical protein
MLFELGLCGWYLYAFVDAVPFEERETPFWSVGRRQGLHRKMSVPGSIGQQYLFNNHEVPRAKKNFVS